MREKHKPNHQNNDPAEHDDQGLSQTAGLTGPLNILKQSIRQVPANKYALGVVGLVAAVSISIGLVRGNWQAAVAGGTAMLVAMVVLRIFAVEQKLADRAPRTPLTAQVLTWLSLSAFAVVLVLLVSKFYTVLFPSSASSTSGTVRSSPSNPERAADPTNLDDLYPHPLPIQPKAIPPDRLLKASPFSTHLVDCTLATCDVTLLFRGYDSKNRLRYEARQTFQGWRIGEFRPTNFGTSDTLYFYPRETVRFQLYCKQGNGPMLSGDGTTLNWTEYMEGGDSHSYYSWVSCGNAQFKAEAGVAVGIATDRINEPAVKVDSGPPR